MLRFDSDISKVFYSLSEIQQLKFIETLKEFEKENQHDERGIILSEHLGVLTKGDRENILGKMIQDLEESVYFSKLRKEASEAALKGETTIPKDRWGVHETHCCEKHGCKYGDEDCPVAIGLTSGVRCESCDESDESDCPDCQGTGDLSGKSQNAYEECTTCKGTGKTHWWDDEEDSHM